MGIIASVQQYDLNIPVGGAQSIDAPGDRVQFLSAVDPFAQIELRPNFAQGNIVLRPGQGFQFSEQVQRWVVFNRGSVPLSGYLLIGSGNFFDQRIAGTVDVIDGGKARTLGGIAFWSGGSQSAVAGQYSFVQLWNPAGSGKNVIVESMDFAADVGSFIGIGWGAAPFATVAANAKCKMLGLPDGVAKINRQANAAFSLPNQYASVQVQALAMLQKKLTEPIIIAPGTGLNVVSGTLNVNLTAVFEWYEENA